MTIAMFCALILVFGGMKVCLWVADRLVSRQKEYDATKVNSTQDPNYVWEDNASKIKLKMFDE